MADIINLNDIKRLTLPYLGEKNKPLPCIENLAALLKCLKVTVRYNVINKEEEILIPGQEFSLDNKQNASLAWLMSACQRVNMSTNHIQDFLNYLTDQNQYNPVITWITSKPWDQKSRLEELYATVKVKNEQDHPKINELKKTLIRKWLISSVAAGFQSAGTSVQGVLVFQGNQDLGKTSWVKRLVPSELDLVAEGKIINPSDKDSVLQAVKFWIVELGELDATFKKSDIAQLKAFLTRDKDLLRRAYARKESYYARRTVFFASVNPTHFLHDETGNRRFWTLQCEDINYSHDIDMQQLWAEIYEDHFKKGAIWYLTKDEIQSLNDSNEKFQQKEPLEERCNTDFDWLAKDESWRWLTATEILAELGIGSPKAIECRNISQAIKKLNRDQQKKSKGIFKLKVPPRINKNIFDLPQ